MITIIHLSDLHMRKSNSASDNRNGKELVRHSKARFPGAPRKNTYVVLTGDLTDDARTNQYKNLESQIIQPLAEQFTVLAVPGNHDYAEAGNLFVKEGPARYAKYVLPHVTAAEPVGANPYPRVTKNAAEKVLLVGLDSADPQDKTWFANGIIREEQRNQLRSVLEDPACDGWYKIVYLHHHPFLRRWFVELRYAAELLNVFRDRVDLVLFGHKHSHEAYFRMCRVPLMLASGKVTESDNDTTLMFRVIEIDHGQSGPVRSEEIARV